MYNFLWHCLSTYPGPDSSSDKTGFKSLMYVKMTMTVYESKQNSRIKEPKHGIENQIRVVHKHNSIMLLNNGGQKRKILYKRSYDFILKNKMYFKMNG